MFSTVGFIALNMSGVIRVSWSAPNVSSEELAILEYSIGYHVRGTTNNNSVLTAQSPVLDLTGLEPGIEYQVFVASVNAIGIGKYCCTRNKVYVRPHGG